MMADLLNTCYAECLLITRPEPPTPLDSSIIDDERETSPVHMSSSASVASSKRSIFSQRLLALDKTKGQQTPEEKLKLTVGRGRGLEQNFSARDILDDQDRFRTHSPTPSTSSTSKFSNRPDARVLVSLLRSCLIGLRTWTCCSSPLMFVFVVFVCKYPEDV